MRQRLVVFAALILCAGASSVTAASAQVPSFAEVTGHEFGQRITLHHEAMLYLRTLAEVSDRVSVIDQGESWEGRRLLVAIVTAPENHARLEAIRDAAGRLADPRITSPDQAAQIIAQQPVIMWYGGSIHGFELSGSEGALKLLERLTTQDDAATMEVLRNAVILIDPMLNPDGRDAFANLNHQKIGRQPNPKPEDWNNNFDRWQGLKFRTGHYYFDTNRDWFALTQRETRYRLPTIVAWHPQIVVDMHEMGSDTEFFFDPGTDPYAPYFPEHSKRWFQIFSHAYASAFDSAGFEYMTREAFDYFYPGYTTSMGDFHGAVGMLYEQGSSRGLALERPDHSVRTLADALEQQYVAAWTAAQTSVARREALLDDYYQSVRADIASGRQGTRRYLIPPEGDPQHTTELANMLVKNGIEVSRLSEPTRLGNLLDREGNEAASREFPAGTYVIEAAQPRYRLVRMLLEPDVPTPDDFLREARARIDRAESPRFYDITAWSLPLLFNVAAYSSSGGELAVQRLDETVDLGASLPAERPGYAYLIDGDQAASVAALYHLKAQGYRASFLQEPTRIEGRDFSSGTIIVRIGQNDESLHDAIRIIAEKYGLRVAGTETGLSEPGFPTLGSGDATFMVRTPEIAILGESPIQGYSFGWAWYTLDRQYEIPVSVLRVGSIAGTPLDRFNVLVVPATNGSALAEALGERGVERIKTWVREGGTLVVIGSGVDFAREQLELIGLRSWYDEEENEDAQRIGVPGAILNLVLDEHAWLTAGYDTKAMPALVESSRIYLMPEGPPSSRQRGVGLYSTDKLRLAGHLWSESVERLPGAVYVYEERVGGGRVVAFAEDPNFRAFCRGANRLFLNAVVVGPSAP
jgi:hypothetical protein